MGHFGEIATGLQRLILDNCKNENYFCLQTSSFSYGNKNDQNLAFTRVVPRSLWRIISGAVIALLLFFIKSRIKGKG